jgi:hypothetical protein
MPIVFVHGVSTRKSPDYDAAVAARDALLRQVFLPAADLTRTALVLNPYWGDEGVTFAYDLASVPTGSEDLVRLGGEAGDANIVAVAAAAAATAPGAAVDRVLLTVARTDLVAAVDLLCAAALHNPIGVDLGSDDELAALAAKAAAYAQAQRTPPGWLADVADDSAFVTRLLQEVDSATVPPPAADAVPPWEALGVGQAIWGRFSAGAFRLRQEVGAFAGKPAWNLLRELLVPTVPRFIGDVFAYLDRRGTSERPGPIIEIVLDALKQGSALRTAEDPLIVIGHSLGGVVTYDVLSGFAPDMSVDVFCTVGSQVALFEEMKLFAASDPGVSAAKRNNVQKPANIAHWINVFDYNDVLSYKLQPVFDGVTDYPYQGGALLHAHGAYFGQPTFFQRLAARVRVALQP